MKTDNRWVRLWIAGSATCFGIGYIPVIPATFASAAAAGVGWLWPAAVPFMAAAAILVSLPVCRGSQKVFRSADPKPFVMDEAAGMFVSLAWIPREAAWFAAAFVLFRALDTVKPWPVSRIQDSPKPSSILWDDVAAGVLVNLILRAAAWCLGVRF